MADSDYFSFERAGEMIESLFPKDECEDDEKYVDNEIRGSESHILDLSKAKRIYIPDGVNWHTYLFGELEQDSDSGKK